MADIGTNEQKRMYTVREVADMLRVSRGTVHSLVEKGELRGPQVGDKRLQRIFVDSYEAYVERNTK